MEDWQRIAQCRAQGLCCAQTQVQMGLCWLGVDNEQLVQASAGLCGGLHQGYACGALTGAACMLALFDAQLAKDEMIAELTEWFLDAYGQDDSVDCRSLLQGDNGNKRTLCPELIEQTCLAAKRILQRHGLL